MCVILKIVLTCFIFL